MKLQAEMTALAVVAAMLGLASTASGQVPGRVARESVDSLGGEAVGSASAPALSADGAIIAFDSDASDLVPGDTNDDTDVFVRDRTTGVVERVSLAWNNNEARDDSRCPSLSSDGRYVAFLSRAWNMYPGGANLGHPRWDVHLRDRQARTTTRVSVAINNGGEPDAESECPSISGDGMRVVFASRATNLVGGDDDAFSDVFLYDVVKNKLKRLTKSADGGDADDDSFRPVISRDGRFVAFESRATNLRESGVPLPPLLPHASTVFVRDLDAGITEAASLKDDGNVGYPYSPQENSFAPSISDDGRYVAFTSDAWNLVVPPPIGSVNVYVRDRVAGRTILASPNDVAQQDCGRDGFTFPCAHPGWIFSASLSGDGRFVTFASRGLQLLPGNLYHGDQVYLFDVRGRRLRRISVEPTGWESDSCSVEPVLSGDARVLAYRSTATNLVAGDANGRADVFSHEWTCDDAGRCRTLASCPAEPRSCAPAKQSLLRIGKRPPGGVHEDQLFWRWTGAASPEAFPDPTADARYQLCVYGKALELDLAAPAAAACSGATRPCWSASGSAYQLLDPGGGLSTLRVTSSNGTPRITLRGTGSLLDAPYLPLVAPDGLVVQLQETDSGRCWGAVFPPSAVARNIVAPSVRGTNRLGRVVARLR